MRGNLMSSRNLLVSLLMACLLAVGFLGIASMTDNASAGKSIRKRDSGRNFVLEMQRRGRGPRIPLPMGPSSIYYDYPYYYSRGHYPTHIGGYVYYPRNYYTRGLSRGPGSARRQRVRGGGR
jgi:hypothetical protein